VRSIRARRACISSAALAAAAVLAGCGSSSETGVTAPQVGAARTYALSGFEPAGAVLPGQRTRIAFTIRTPAGSPLTAYRQCCDPHAGVDLIVVRTDDSHVQYDDSDIAPDGRVQQPIVFPAPGRYRIVIDAYPRHINPGSPINFQLFTNVTVRGPYRPQPVGTFRPVQIVDGYRFQIVGQSAVKALQAGFLTVHVTDRAGRKVRFSSWRGALAHAIFIHEGSLDYFHTHVCSPGAMYCTSALGATRVTGSSSAPGELTVGVLLPVPGRWRMFLLTYLHGHVVTVPYTLTAT
jgi:hypothetical protein